MKQSDQRGDLFAALAKVQADMPAVVKDNKVDAGRIRYSYADLASVLDLCLPRLAAQGLCLTQHPMVDRNGNMALRTTLGHASGQYMCSDYPIQPVNHTPQQVGSAITYARRYAAMAILGIATEDDDGAAASRPMPANDSHHREVRPAARAHGRVPAGTRSRERTSDSGHTVPSELYEELCETLMRARTAEDFDTAASLAHGLDNEAEKQQIRELYAMRLKHVNPKRQGQAKDKRSASVRSHLTKQVLEGDETA